MKHARNNTTIHEEGLRARLEQAGIRTSKRRFSYTNGSGRNSYIEPDITIEAIRLVIEVDGKQHLYGKQLEADKKRDETIRKKGYEVIHVQNRDLIHPKDFEMFVTSIVKRWEAKKKDSQTKNYPAIRPTEDRSTKSHTDIQNDIWGPKHKPSKYDKPFRLFFTSLLIDVIGMIPFGPLDLLWAWVPKWWIMKAYNNQTLSWVGLIEEMLPFTDIIPTCLISHFVWLFRRKK